MWTVDCVEDNKLNKTSQKNRTLRTVLYVFNVILWSIFLSKIMCAQLLLNSVRHTSCDVGLVQPEVSLLLSVQLGN